jgi:hypothetical protein
MDDRKAFSEVMQLLAATYSKEATIDLIEAYWGALKDLPLEDVQFAAQTARMRMEYMPRPAHLRKLAGDVEPDHRAAIAWEVVRKAIGQYGTYQSIDFDDPVINATIRNLGGWIELGRKKGQDFNVWTRKEFERIYQAIYSSGVTEEASAYLVGITEHENAGRYEIKPPIKVRLSLPPPNVRRLSSGKVPKEIAAEVVAKAFALAGEP